MRGGKRKVWKPRWLPPFMIRPPNDTDYEVEVRNIYIPKLPSSVPHHRLPSVSLYILMVSLGRVEKFLLQRPKFKFFGMDGHGDGCRLHVPL